MPDSFDGDVESLRGWMPIRWSWQSGQPALDWCDFGDVRLTAPFFAQSVQDAQDRSRALRRTDAAALTRWPHPAPGARPSGLIFHLSRCGSTLAAQALAALPENIVLSEPELVDAVLRSSVVTAGVSDARRVEWLQGLARVYGQRRFPENRRLFIKFDTWHVLDFHLIRKAFPGVPWIFLYRDPIEILVSQMTQVSGRMLPGPMSATWMEMDLLEALQTPQEDFCARALGRVAAAGLEAAVGNSLGRLVNYSQLPEALENEIAPWLGVELDADARERIRQKARFHAKSPETLFASDAAAKQKLATPALRELTDRWVGETYRQLESWRLNASGERPAVCLR